ncbi:MAG TPA: alpha/beta hydrolase [Conexibacter sp.]|nr:alpha/beta hydrolase [Conexibacter sp.]
MKGIVAWRRAGLSLLAGVLVASLSPSEVAALPTHECPSVGARAARCLRVDVSLDRGGAQPGTLGLRVRILPPVAGTASETVVALAGGPGQAGAPLLSEFRLALSDAVLRSRRLVAFDQRGTGRSGFLDCPSLGAALGTGRVSPAALEQAVGACATRLGPARTHYTTAASVEDVEAVRVALGVEKLTLYGTSYGTKVALDYAAAHPAHVSRLLLDSTLLPEGVDPFERATIASIPRVMRAICAARGCRFTSDAGADVVALAQRLARGPLHGPWVDGRGRVRQIGMRQIDLLRLLLESDASPFERALLPAAVRAARTGDPALLLRLAAIPPTDEGDGGSDSVAVLVATRCEDGGVSWPAGTPVSQRRAAVGAALAALPPTQLAPFTIGTLRETGVADLCNAWPESPIPQPRLPLPDVPTLILSGDVDLRTPRSYAVELAARLPHAQLLTVPHTGHSVLGSDFSGCASGAVEAFFAGRPVGACGPSARESLMPPADPPARRFDRMRPPRGLPPRVGRTVAAVNRTLAFMEQTLLLELLPRLLAADRHTQAFRIGGLRAGSLTIRRGGFILRRYTVVPGAALSARVREGDDSNAPVLVHVGGRLAAHGQLRIGDRWMAGRLAGRRVRVRVPRSAADGGSLIARAARRTPPGVVPIDQALKALPRALRTLLGE